MVEQGVELLEPTSEAMRIIEHKVVEHVARAGEETRNVCLEDFSLNFARRHESMDRRVVAMAVVVDDVDARSANVIEGLRCSAIGPSKTKAEQLCMDMPGAYRRAASTRPRDRILLIPYLCA